MTDPNAWYETYHSNLMSASRAIALRRMSTAQDEQERRARARREVEALAQLQLSDPHYFPSGPKIEKADPATAEALRDVADLLRQLLERPQVAPVVNLTLAPEIVATIAPHKERVTVTERDKFGRLISAEREIS